MLCVLSTNSLSDPIGQVLKGHLQDSVDDRVTANDRVQRSSCCCICEVSAIFATGPHHTKHEIIQSVSPANNVCATAAKPTYDLVPICEGE